MGLYVVETPVSNLYEGDLVYADFPDYDYSDGLVRVTEVFSQVVGGRVEYVVRYRRLCGDGWTAFRAPGEVRVRRLAEGLLSRLA